MAKIVLLWTWHCYSNFYSFVLCTHIGLLLTHNGEYWNANVFSVVVYFYRETSHLIIFLGETTKLFFSFFQILDRFQKSDGDPFFVFLLFYDSAVLLRNLVKFFGTVVSFQASSASCYYCHRKILLKVNFNQTMITLYSFLNINISCFNRGSCK